MTVRWRLKWLVATSIALPVIAGFGAFAEPTAAQDDGFTLGILVTNCDTLPTAGPFQNGGCEPADGYFEATTESGDVLDYCSTSAGGDGLTSGCSVTVPFGSTVVVWMDESTVAPGYVLHSLNPQTIDIPDGPPDGLFGGPIFINLVQGGSAPPQNGGGEVEDEAVDAVTDLPATGVGESRGGVQGNAWLLFANGLAVGGFGLLVARKRGALGQCL